MTRPKNRRVFNDVATLWGIPTGLVLFGLVLCVGLYAAVRSVFAVLIIAPAYFIPMYLAHKDDPRGLKIWLSVLGDNINQWQCARRKPIVVIFRRKSF